MAGINLRGRFYWEVMFDRKGTTKGSGMGCCYYVGIATGAKLQWDQSLSEAAPNWKHTWCLHDNNGSHAQTDVKHNNASKNYGNGYGFKNRVGVLVDMDLAIVGASSLVGCASFAHISVLQVSQWMASHRVLHSKSCPSLRASIRA